jgi:hypothetical protein
MKTEKKTLITAVLAIGMIAASGTATAATSVSAFPAPAAFVMPTHDGGGGGGTGGAGTGSGGSGSGTTTGSSSTTITGNYAQSYTGRGNNGCPFTPGDLGCRGELMSGGQVVCSPC